MRPLEQFDGAPGADLVAAGLTDLAEGRQTAAALLVCVARTRLRSVGVDVPALDVDHPWHRLYDLLAEDDARTAHGRFNALVRRLASFARAAEHAPTR